MTVCCQLLFLFCGGLTSDWPLEVTHAGSHSSYDSEDNGKELELIPRDVAEVRVHSLSLLPAMGQLHLMPLKALGCEQSSFSLAPRPRQSTLTCVCPLQVVPC